MKKSRNWCFTSNNPSIDYEKYILQLPSRYTVFQKEVGESGTPHFQGTICFQQARHFKSIKEDLPGCHLEPCKDLQASIKYCMKDEGRLDGPWESGERPSQGKRNELETVVDMVQKKRKLREIAEECPLLFIKFHKGIEALRSRLATPRNWEMLVYVHHGATGTGKTRSAFEQCEDPYMKPDGDWWNGYDGHEDIIIDDFACTMPITFLLKVLDRYPLQVQTKGGFVEFVAKRIFITSNIPYCEWYSGARQEHREALRRRITKIIHFNPLPFGAEWGASAPPPQCGLPGASSALCV
nr:MAG: replication associated protein [Cressdnaviricota sp.]